MVRLIAHRGNYAGRNPERENTIEYLQEALDQGYWIECDIQMVGDDLFFGHDDPQEPVSYEIVMNSRTICHAKDLDALLRLMFLGAHAFWHENDTVTLTSRGQIWCYPGYHPRYDQSIWLDLLDCPLPDDISGIFGICADDLTQYK